MGRELKVKEPEREKLKSNEYIHTETIHLHDYMSMCVFLGL